MNIPIVILRTSGQIESAPFHADSLAGAAALEPEGVYTVARTFQTNRAVLLDAHLDRLEESSQLISKPVFLDRDRIRSALRDLIQRTNYPESRFRITLPSADPGEVIIALEPLEKIPESVYREGVKVSTYSIHRDNPRAKTNDWVRLRVEARKALPQDVYEVIALGLDERLLEGFSSNFYALLDGVLHLEPERALRGIARMIVLQVCKDLVPMEMVAVRLVNLPQLAEAFISSSSRGVVPVVQIDDTSINQGVPGPLTREIQSRYDSWVDSNLEPI